MRVLSKLLAAGAMAAGVAMAAAPAHAVTLFVGPVATTTAFGDAPGVGGGASFSDSYSFTLTKAGVISGSISSAYNKLCVSKCGTKKEKDLTQNLAFITAKLDGTPFVFTSNGAGVSALGSLAFTPIGLGAHTLLVTGSNLGNTISSYNGTLNFLPVSVPEPATWAMTITGFGLLGVAARRRRVLSAARSIAV